MMRAVTTRDPAWDGLFIVAVRTTGIACRPVCPSRPALPENREVFATLAAAEAAGYRPCRRCHPGRPAPSPPWLPRLEAAVASAGERRAPAKVETRFAVPPRLTFGAWHEAMTRAGRRG